MIQELPIRNTPILPFRFKRYFESKNNKVRIFGQCEVTGNFRCELPFKFHKIPGVVFHTRLYYRNDFSQVHRPKRLLFFREWLTD